MDPKMPLIIIENMKYLLVSLLYKIKILQYNLKNIFYSKLYTFYILLKRKIGVIQVENIFLLFI